MNTPGGSAVSQLTLSPDIQRLTAEKKGRFADAGYLSNLPLFDAGGVAHL